MNEPTMTNESESDDIDLESLAPEAPQDTAPKRRGRPRGSKNLFSSAAENVAGAVKRGRTSAKAKVRGQVAMLVGGLNLGLASSKYRADCLDEREMTALTDALTAECMSSERVVKWMLAASGITPHLMLLQAVVMIAVPRLQRRGILPGSPVQPEMGNTNGHRPVADETPAPESESEPATYSPLASVFMEARGTPIPIG